MAYKALPSQEVLRQLLDYEPETGRLFWRPREPRQFNDQKGRANRAAITFNKNFANKPAFTHMGNKGYLVGSVDGVNYMAHRIVWKFCTGRDPAEQIDHINGNRADNRIGNLREADNQQNQANAKKHKNWQDSPYKGVSVHKKSGRWICYIGSGPTRTYLGIYDTPEQAAAAYDAAARARHGAFARLNFPDEAA